MVLFLLWAREYARKCIFVHSRIGKSMHLRKYSMQSSLQPYCLSLYSTDPHSRPRSSTLNTFSGAIEHFCSLVLLSPLDFVAHAVPTRDKTSNLDIIPLVSTVTLIL